MSESTPAKDQKAKGLNEDWAVVWLGFLIVAVVLYVYVVPVPSFGWKDSSEIGSKILTASNLTAIVIQFVFVFIFGILAMLVTGKPVRSFLTVFPVIFLITLAAVFITGNTAIKNLGLEAVIFSLSLGLLVGNLFNLPQWFRSALNAELFVKIGLVLLGCGVIFGDIVKAGGLGLLQALIVVLSVWYFAFWICKKFKLDEELTMMISSAVSICGVSAAIATAGAIKGDPKKLSYVISLVLITAMPMMIGMPYIARFFGWSQEVTGAWLGGTIDTTGAVVASGTLVGETALQISTIVKLSQNVLLGLAAFAISIYWTYSSEKPGKDVEKPTLGLIWERFPKFVLGFVATSLFFSFLISPEKVKAVKDSIKSIQTLWFVLAFTSIGLETRFKDIFNSEGQKPLYAFLIAQGFNIIITLIIAILLFG
ncbi:MAG TPA: putative sulfate exporter family transporter [Cyclobacteriaceae bacterium]|nr:putative sulfate exporter family transporter [Cyclobacteriaceae bacterium]